MHIAALIAEKRAAHQHSSTDRLQHAAPRSRAFLMRAADRGQHRAALGRPAPLTAQVLQDPRLRDVVIRPHALGLYDALQPRNDEEDDHADIDG